MSNTPITPAPTFTHSPPLVATVPYIDLGGAASSLCEAVLGAFEIKEVVGQGGMGVVFAATHTLQKTPVAVKVITRRGVEHPFIRQSLRNEVQAAATLNHPGIVRLLDYGDIGEEAEMLTEGELRAGSPFFVMEYLPLGSLADLVGRVTWRQTKAILLTVLDALAHAHAMDVVHRDIKPGNILLAEFGGRTIPKLADFGLAFATEVSHDTSRAVGTPHYMAPEQMQQPWRKHGPWSDLYSLGCVAFELVTGKRAFTGSSAIQIFTAHAAGKRRPLRTVLRLPNGFESWLDMMLAVQVSNRFQNAAEAARALMAIDDSGLREVRPPAPTELPIGGVTPVLDVFRPAATKAEAFDHVFSGIAPLPQDLPTIPEQWRSPRYERTPMRLVGAGLGLFGLRTIPIVGRTKELEIGWQSLREVARTKSPEVVLFRGAEGCGKSRLGDSFVQRVRELGVAEVLTANYAPTPSVANGIPRMMARHFRTLGATRVETSGIVREQMRNEGVEEPYEWQAMAALVAEGMDLEPMSEEVSHFRFATPRQRHAALVRYLEALSAKGPTVIWIDDAQWGTNAMEFVRFLLESGKTATLPVLVVMSVTDDVIANDREARQLLQALCAHASCTELNLPPLSDSEHEELIGEIANLEPDLALELCDRTAGNPRLAVELIGDWVARGLLEVGESGFVLRQGAKATIPDSLHDAWDDRIREITREHGPDAQTALELAAALGHNVNAAEWSTVCRLARIEIDPNLQARLVERRFARRTDTGWSFAHSIGRQSLERNSREAGRWRTHMMRCAYFIELQRDIERPENAERYGRYLQGAEEYERAVAPLLSGAKGRQEQGEYREAHRLVSNLLRCLEHAQVPDTDPRWGEAWSFRAHIYINSGDPKTAKRWAERAMGSANAHDWHGVKLSASSLLALSATLLGDPAAPSEVQAALDLLQASPESAEQWVYGFLARILTSMRRFDEADSLLEAARTSATRAWNIAHIYHNRCRLAIFRQDWEDAQQWGEKARNGFEYLGHFPAMAGSMEYLAEIHKQLGEVDSAAAIYRECIVLQRSLGSPTVISQLNLAAMQLGAGAFEEAESLYLVSVEATRALGTRRLEVAATAGILAAAAGLSRTQTVAELARTIEAFMDESMELEPEIATLLEKAGDLLVDQDHPIVAENVLLLAARQYEHVGQSEHAETVRKKASNLDFFP